MFEKIKSVKWGYILIGLLLAAIGLCFLVFNNSLMVLALTIGIILTVFGIVFGTVTIANKTRGFSFAVKMVFSVICLVCGIITMIFSQDELSVAVLTEIFSLLLIIDGSFKLNTSAMSKRFSVGGWWAMMAVSVLVIMSAFLLMEFKSKFSSEVTTALLGIVIMVDAVANLFSTVWVAKYETAGRAEAYYEICRELKYKEEKEQSNLNKE